MPVYKMVNLKSYQPIYKYFNRTTSPSIFVVVTPTQDKFQEGQKDVLDHQRLLTEDQAKDARTSTPIEIESTPEDEKSLVEYLSVNNFKPIQK